MMKIKKRFLTILFITAFTAFPLNSRLFAQVKSDGVNQVIYEINFVIILILITLVFSAFFYYGMEQVIERPKRFSKIFNRVKNYFIGLAPIEKEKDILMDHDFDGIKELDNRIPPWFNYLFYGTIIFGVIYMVDYHIIKTGKLPEQEYREEMELAAIQRAELTKSGALVNENNVSFLADESALSEGKKIFKVNCVPCHGENGQGIIGPNLTDEYWIHGGGIKNVYKIIKYGVPLKGMLTWEGKLNPREIQEAASYVLSLKGTNPPNAKEPQGQKWIETDSTKIESKKL